jgi:hypothetical protein
MRASRMEEIVRGQTVLCKEFNGCLIERLIWEDSGALILIHTDDQFRAHFAGLPHLEPVGFPVEDVFVRDIGDGLRPYKEENCPVTAQLE